MSIPKFRNSAMLPFAGEEAVQSRFDGVRVGANQFVRANCARFRSFGIVTQGDARHPHNGCFFGDSATISNNGFGAFHEVVEFQISHWLHDMEIWEECMQLLFVAP